MSNAKYQGVVIRVAYIASEASHDHVEVMTPDGTIVCCYRCEVAEDRDGEGVRNPQWSAGARLYPNYTSHRQSRSLAGLAE